MTTRPSRLALLLAPMAALAALVLTGCSGSGSDAGSGDRSGSSTSAADGPAAAASNADLADVDGAKGSARSGVARTAADYDRRVIRTGTVELDADDVGKVQFEVQRLVDRHQGQVADEKTSSDEHGRAAYTRMVLRVPEKEFGPLVEDLKKVGRLVSATTAEEDVTTKVIDLQTRITVQKRSIARITTLFERAEAIKDVMAIESELAARQADLDSLEQQAAYLAGQSTLSTITVSIDQTPPVAKHEKEKDRSGFVSGLSGGWDALSGFGNGVATVAGALLPWLVVLGLLTPPALLVGRLVRRRLDALRAGRSGRTPSAA